MADRRNNPGAYRLAQLAARAREGALSSQQLRGVIAAVNTYAAELARLVRVLPPSEQTRRLRQQRILFNRVARQLENTLRISIQRGRNTSFRSILDIWNQAGLDAARAGGVEDGLLGAVRRPAITLLGAYEGIGASNWRTLLTQYVGRAAREVDTIVERALLEGVNTEVLSRRLRPYVQGAETFEKAFGGLGFDPQRLRDPALANSARMVRFNASRIAVSEIHNARSEAEVQHFVADPLVRGVFWRLAPDRGPTARVDQCDVLALSDFYGGGPGWYPIDSVPLTPHPHDRCERVPQVRSSREAGQPKPLGLQRKSAFLVGKLGRGARVTKSRGQTIRSETEQLLRLTDEQRPDVTSLLRSA